MKIRAQSPQSSAQQTQGGRQSVGDVRVEGKEKIDRAQRSGWVWPRVKTLAGGAEKEEGCSAERKGLPKGEGK